MNKRDTATTGVRRIYREDLKATWTLHPDGFMAEISWDGETYPRRLRTQKQFEAAWDAAEEVEK